MLSLIISFLATVLGELAKSWFAQRAATQAQNQAIVSQVKADADEITIKALDARSSFVPLTTASLSAIKPGTDPNFRD